MVNRPHDLTIYIRQEGDQWVVDPNGGTVQPGYDVQWICEGSDVIFWFPQEDAFGQAMATRSSGQDLVVVANSAAAGRRVPYAVYVVAKEGFATGLDGNEPHILIGDGP